MKKMIMALTAAAFLLACAGKTITEQQAVSVEEEIQLVDEISAEIDEAIQDIHAEVDKLSDEIDELLNDI